MNNKPIYLTDTRFLYNIAKIDYRNGKITNEEFELRKEARSI